jgi:hypothetical protein
LISELRRRAYLSAMQVASWLPRVELPFAAPSRPELLQPLAEPEAPAALEPAAEPVMTAAPAAGAVAERVANPEVVQSRSSAMAEVRAKIDPAKPAAPAQEMPVAVAAEPETVAPDRVAPSAPPRFALQLMRVGACAVLVELPTGEPLQGRDPAFLLLKDMLRAAGLQDTPQAIGEPVRWPLLAGGQIDQGPHAAQDYVQTFVSARLEEQAPCACLWLVGLPAIRFCGDADADHYNRELQIDGLGAAWALPGLELLMEEPERKRELWHAMQRVRQRWMSQAE